MTNPDTPPDGPDLDDVLFEQAVSAHEAGQFEEADRLYRMVHARTPDDAVVLELLGQVSLSCGRAEEAVEQLARSVEVDPACASAWFAYASALDSCDRAGEAEAAVMRAIGIDPYLAGVRAMLAGLLLRRGEVEQGTAEAERVLEVPRPAPIELRAVARAAWAAGELGLAARCLMRLESPDEEDFEQMSALSGALFGDGDLASMDALLRHLHRCRPGHEETGRNLAAHLANHRQEREAVEVLRSTLEASPSAVEPRFDLLELHHRLGEHTLVRAQHEILSRCGGGWRLAWASASHALKSCYADESEIAESRAALIERLARAEETLELQGESQRFEALAAIKAASFFMLPAQGAADRDVAVQLGRVVTSVVSSIAPDLMEHPQPARSPDGRIRVGVLSGYFRSHSNWRSHLNWLGTLDKSGFETIGFATQPGRGEEYRLARERYDRLEVVLDDPIATARRIRDERLHAIVIPEVGMDPIVRIVAAARLAPTQIASWGHPVTSGYSACNWFLSSDLMEPPDAQDHYSEQLLRLAGIGFQPTPTEAELRTPHRDRAAGSPGRMRYWCCQAPHKYLPRHDWMFPEIASRVPGVEFCFVGIDDNVRSTIGRRLGTAFEARGLDAGDHVRWMPRCSSSEFREMGASMDVFLDCPAWSGCNTALDAVWSGTPIVAMEGSLMRARHASAMLRVMGLDECVAIDVDGLVDLACRAGTDPEWRRHLSESMGARRDRLWTLHDPVAEFERFLEAEAAPVG